MAAPIADSGPWTVSRLLSWTRDYLQRQDVDSPRLCAEILLAHAMSCERIHLYTRYESVPATEVLERFRSSVQAAAAGRPIAYLTGSKEFFSLRFEVTPDVLIPRPETEVLVERAIDLVRHAERPPARIADIGTGTGCIAVALACHLPGPRLFASDISTAALEVARRNAQRHDVATRIELAAGDLLAAWNHRPDPPGPFDVIVSNPPYVATAPGTPVARSVRDFEPAVALFAGHDGLDVIRRLIDEAPACLAPDGHLLLEIGYDQASAVRALLAAAGWRKTVLYRDPAGIERVVHAQRPPIASAE